MADIKNPKITLEELSERLSYNADTGEFRWIKHSVSTSVGTLAGTTMKRGYVQIRLDDRLVMGHRLAWLFITGSWPDGPLDHINHVKNDNRKCNLRAVDHAVNVLNLPLSKRNKSGFTGVSWDKRAEKWRASITTSPRRTKNLGNFEDKFDAICARASANNKYGFHENHGARR